MLIKNNTKRYENKEQSDADTSGHVGPKIRVWGEPQQAAFVPLVATEALLATMVLVLRSSQPVSYTDAQTQATMKMC